MTNRTVKILGKGFGAETATIEVTLAGAQIYAGTVPTAPLADLPSLPNLDLSNSTVTLTSFNVPVSYSGTQAMTCTVTSGTVIFSQIVANYASIFNPVYTESDLAVLNSPTTTPAEKVAVINSHAVPPLSEAEITLLESTDPVDNPAKEAILASHNVSFTISSGPGVFVDVDSVTDPRDNVTINGTPVTPDHGDLPGTWWFQIEQGSVLGYDLTIAAGLE